MPSLHCAIRAGLAAVGLAVLIGASAPHSAPSASALSCVPREQCCKICNKGQACGNTCISRRYNCHKGRGCACDADEVCGE